MSFKTLINSKNIGLKMATIQYPELVNNYLTFCNYREEARKSNSLDLRWCNFLFPTTLLPLGVLLQTRKIKYLKPHSTNVSNYIDLITGKLSSNDVGGLSYVPFVSLPANQEKTSDVFSALYKLHNDGKEYGGEDAFKYIINELVDNIYEHSEFKHALVMAQKYAKKEFVEICIYDDGVTIGGGFRKHGINVDDENAITQAILGKSTKSEERGYGLSTSIAIFTQGLHGEILIVSGSAGLYLGKQRNLYKFEEVHKLQGTLISIRVRYPAQKVNIYDFI